MSIFAKRRSWYADGLAFECLRCGRCCAGPGEGYVWIAPEEIQALAEFLRIPVEEVHRRHLRRVGKRYSLREEPGSKDCIFLRYDGEGLSRCMIYPVRPAQCGTWPFWPANLASKGAWCLGGMRCPGINRGPLHEFDEIQRKRDRTRH